MNDNEFNVAMTSIVVFSFLAFLLTFITLIYQYNRADLAFQERMMSNGYVQVIESGNRLWKPAGVKIEVDKPAGGK